MKKLTLATMLALSAAQLGMPISLSGGGGEATPSLGRTGRRRKGQNKQPRQSSKRFVAQDKRDARKARRRG